MTGRYSDDRRSDDRPRIQVHGAGVRAERPGPYLGPVRITPARVTLLVALAGGLGFLAWSALVRDTMQIPLMASGFAICGLVFAATAVMAATNVVRAGREGRDEAAVATALMGGLLAIAAFLSFAASVIMSLIWSGTKGT